MPMHMKELLEEAHEEKGMKLGESIITILGFAFLENSDDTRNTPALTLYNILEKECHKVLIHDPYVRSYEDVQIIRDIEKAIKGSDGIALVTQHREYYELSPEWLKKTMRTPIIVDGRNVFNPEKFLKLGFSFRGVGIPKKHL